MTNPRLSVILPNYNHAHLLPRAIDALLRQERPADEIIIVDDGSVDDSRAVIARYASEHRAIRVILHDGNRGTVAALTTGIDAALGHFIYMAAADDEVLPGFFRDGLDLLERNPQSGLFCAEATIVDGKTGACVGVRPTVRPSARPAYLDPRAVAGLFRRADFVLLTGSSLIRRDLAIKFGGLDPEAGSLADSLLTRKIAFGHGFCYLPRPVAIWRTFDDSFSFSTVLSVRGSTRILKDISDKIAADPDFPSWYAEQFRRRWRFASAKLIAARKPLDREALTAVAGPTVADRVILSLLGPLASARWGYLAFLSWLTLRFRPYRLRDVLVTWLTRRLVKPALRAEVDGISG